MLIRYAITLKYFMIDNIFIIKPDCMSFQVRGIFFIFY